MVSRVRFGIQCLFPGCRAGAVGILPVGTRRVDTELGNFTGTLDVPISKLGTEVTVTSFRNNIQ